MPIENEYKFALHDPEGKLEARLLASDYFRVAIRQGYIRKGARIREWRDLQAQSIRYIFTYKQRVDDDVIEIETDISEDDFNRLWSVREYDVTKIRFKFIIDDVTWDVDFLKQDGKTYFSLAEVELPENQRTVPTPPDLIKDYVLGGTGRHDKTLSNKRLLHVEYAKQVEAAFIAGEDAVRELVSTYQVT